MSKRRNKRISRRKDLRIGGRKNKELRYNQLQIRKERAANVRDYVAAGDSQDERKYRSEKYKAERLRREYAKMKRIEREQNIELKKQRKREYKEAQIYRQLKKWFKLLLLDPFAPGYYEPGTKRSQSLSKSPGENPSASSPSKVRDKRDSRKISKTYYTR